MEDGGVSPHVLDANAHRFPVHGVEDSHSELSNDDDGVDATSEHWKQTGSDKDSDEDELWDFVDPFMAFRLRNR